MKHTPQCLLPGFSTTLPVFQFFLFFHVRWNNRGLYSGNMISFTDKNCKEIILPTRGSQRAEGNSAKMNQKVGLEIVGCLGFWHRWDGKMENGKTVKMLRFQWKKWIKGFIKITNISQCGWVCGR